jgi:predicted anti-sigma-YlaC factor YlaD
MQQEEGIVMTDVPKYRDSKFWLDISERIAWTAAEAGVAILSTVQFDLPAGYVPVIAAVLAAAKGFVARHLVSASQDSASTAPGV